MRGVKFQALIWQKGRELYRDMPWRTEPSFYNVLVSEVMLQQTQVPRVLVKFREFMMQFPSIEALAAASLSDVLVAWQGLGYNRRAKFLHEAAKYIVKEGEPTAKEGLQLLPGIGKHTAGAMMNYVYDIPTPFIETNIRSVYFHHFFEGQTEIPDNEVLSLVEKTMDKEHPREWFWAVMDYGAWLKSQGKGAIMAGRHYRKQSPLRGSVREVRGQIIRVLAAGEMTVPTLKQQLNADGRFDAALGGLERERLVNIYHDTIYLTK